MQKHQLSESDAYQKMRGLAMSKNLKLAEVAQRVRSGTYAHEIAEVRAVLASLVVAIVLGVGYLAYDLALRRGVDLPGGDLRTLYLLVDVVVVLVSGSVVTWLIVPQPRGSGTTTTRSAWSAALGFFAAVPVCYLVLVVVVQVIEPLLG